MMPSIKTIRISSSMHKNRFNPPRRAAIMIQALMTVAFSAAALVALYLGWKTVALGCLVVAVMMLFFAAARNGGRHRGFRNAGKGIRRRAWRDTRSDEGSYGLWFGLGEHRRDDRYEDRQDDRSYSDSSNSSSGDSSGDSSSSSSRSSD
jgi:hypothetical protein